MPFNLRYRLTLKAKPRHDTATTATSQSKRKKDSSTSVLTSAERQHIYMEKMKNEDREKYTEHLAYNQLRCQAWRASLHDNPEHCIL